MGDQVKCKRIIDGKTYNTETATLLWHCQPDDGPHDVSLYKTRHGAYFAYVFDELRPDEWIEPLDCAAAQKWLEKNCYRPEILEAEFGEIPEGGEAEARITLRIPETLRRRIAALAECRNQSLNAWMLRCLERCAATAEEETTK